MKSTIFWDITLCIPLKVNQLSREHISLLPAFMLVSCSAYLNLKMEVTCPSEMLLGFKQTTWCYILGDSSLHEGHKSAVHKTGAVYFSIK
jgi:hypothetical protein